MKLKLLPTVMRIIAAHLDKQLTLKDTTYQQYHDLYTNADTWKGNVDDSVFRDAEIAALKQQLAAAEQKVNVTVTNTSPNAKTAEMFKPNSRRSTAIDTLLERQRNFRPGGYTGAGKTTLDRKPIGFVATNTQEFVTSWYNAEHYYPDAVGCLVELEAKDSNRWIVLVDAEFQNDRYLNITRWRYITSALNVVTVNGEYKWRKDLNVDYKPYPVINNESFAAAPREDFSYFLQVGDEQYQQPRPKFVVGDFIRGADHTRGSMTKVRLVVPDTIVEMGMSELQAKYGVKWFINVNDANANCRDYQLTHGRDILNSLLTVGPANSPMIQTIDRLYWWFGQMTQRMVHGYIKGYGHEWLDNKGQHSAKTVARMIARNLQKDDENNLFDICNLIMMLHYHGGNAKMILDALNDQTT